SSRELEDEETADGGDPADTVRRLPTAAFARPVINVTVPIQTLMGLTDDPGVMSGGETIPATLARRLAQDPDSTWYRMLTDPARKCVELSTKSYRPTKPIWRQVVADHQNCFLPTCNIPATRCEADHKVPYPEGATSTGNLHPGCRRDHKAKHARGFHVVDQNGSTQLRTAAGFIHTLDPPEQPVAEWPDLSALDEEPTAEEFLNTLTQIRRERES
ncbi:MAG: HNH endonuclease signature motif containing protein, partial [Actinomycetes bacterium]